MIKKLNFQNFKSKISNFLALDPERWCCLLCIPPHSEDQYTQEPLIKGNRYTCKGGNSIKMTFDLPFQKGLL